MSWLRRPGRRRRIAFPAFGGDVRPAVMGPSSIKAQLARLAFVRVLLTTIILVVALADLAFALRTPGIMNTELFLADGSAVGCHVRAFLGGEG